jgi:hypothetical protein
MASFLVAAGGLFALLIVGGLAFAVVLICSIRRTTERCLRCGRPRGMKPTSAHFKAVTRRTLVTETGSPNVIERDEQVVIPLSDSELLHRCRFCGYEEARTQLDVDDARYTIW